MTQGLPHELHLWSPVVASGTAGAPYPLALTAATARGEATRHGTGSAPVLGLLIGVGHGAKRVAAAAGARAVPITFGAGAGLVLVSDHGPGEPYPLAGLSTNGQGVKQAKGFASPLAYPFPAQPAHGFAAKQGRGLAFTLARPFAAAAGRKITSGPGAGQVLTPLVRDQQNWIHNRHYEFFLTGPTDVTHEPMAAPLSRLFVSSTRIGQTVWRSGGIWQAANRPNPVLLEGADVVFPGGYRNALTDELRASLTDQGFGPYIELLEVRP